MDSYFTIALFAVAVACAALVVVGVALMIELRRSKWAFELAFRGLDQTNRLGFETVTLVQERLERRVKALERGERGERI